MDPHVSAYVRRHAATPGTQSSFRRDEILAMKLPQLPRMELWLLRSGEILTLDDAPPPSPQQLSLF